VGRKLRRGGLAVAACLIETVAAACSSSGTPGSASPAASAAHGTLIVFGAGARAISFGRGGGGGAG
jgi:hypothetical protein